MILQIIRMYWYRVLAVIKLDVDILIVVAANDGSHRYNRRHDEQPMFTSLLSDVVRKAQ